VRAGGDADSADRVIDTQASRLRLGHPSTRVRIEKLVANQTGTPLGSRWGPGGCPTPFRRGGRIRVPFGRHLPISPPPSERAGHPRVTILRKCTWGLDLAGHNQSPERERGVTIDSAGGIGGLLATEDVADTKDYYYLYDANGNVGQVLDASDGSIAAKYEYDAYGNNLLDPTDPNESGPYAADNPFRFSTK
jgi:hypothetical protein